MAAVISTETPLNFHQTIRCYILGIVLFIDRSTFTFIYLRDSKPMITALRK
jgi:hypothetical protein